MLSIATLADIKLAISLACFGYDHVSPAERRTAVGLLMQGVPAAAIARTILMHRHTPEDGWIGT